MFSDIDAYVKQIQKIYIYIYISSLGHPLAMRMVVMFSVLVYAEVTDNANPGLELPFTVKAGSSIFIWRVGSRLFFSPSFSRSIHRLASAVAMPLAMVCLQISLFLAWVSHVYVLRQGLFRFCFRRSLYRFFWPP